MRLRFFFALSLRQAGAFLLRTGYFLGAGGDISWGQAGKHLISRAKSTAEAIRAENNTKTRAEPPKSTIRTENTPNSRAKPTNSIIRAESITLNKNLTLTKYLLNLFPINLQCK